MHQLFRWLILVAELFSVTFKKLISKHDVAFWWKSKSLTNKKKKKNIFSNWKNNINFYVRYVVKRAHIVLFLGNFQAVGNSCTCLPNVVALTKVKIFFFLFVTYLNKPASEWMKATRVKEFYPGNLFLYNRQKLIPECQGLQRMSKWHDIHPKNSHSVSRIEKFHIKHN